VVRAYTQLAAEGYLDLRRGAAPSVREPQSVARAARDVTAITQKTRYDLRPHLPDSSLFPRHAWLRSLRNALTAAGTADLNYSDARGLEQLRAEIAAYLGRARGITAEPDQIVITAGCTHSLSTAARLIARTGATKIALENPSQSSVHGIVRHAGLSTVGVSLDQDGMLVGELEVASVAAAVISAGHQFPTGSLLSRTRQAALVRWAAKAGALIIEDEYDAGLRPDWTPISARDDLARDRVIYLGSTGKTLSPAVRLGWAVVPRALMTAFVEEVARSVRQISTIEQLAFADFLRRGEFDRHLRQMRALFRQRRAALIAACERGLPSAPVREAAAGLNLLIELPSLELEQAALHETGSRGIKVETVSQHTLPGYRGPAGLVLGVGGLPEGAISHVVEELAQALATAGAVLTTAA
jgi:GntR family transcriptional regulator / MocR family aminotransferase